MRSLQFVYGQPEFENLRKEGQNRNREEDNKF